MDPTTNLEEFAKLFIEAVRGGNVALIATLALLGVVAGVRKYVPLPFLKTRVGGWLSLFLFAGLGAIATALLAGTPFSAGLLMSAVGIGFSAAGGYEALKDFLPYILRLIGMLPNRVAEAEKAGEDAANAEPAKGVEVSVTPISSGSFGSARAEQIAKIDADLRAQGYVKQPDGTYKRGK